jgi:hypothetical protein
MDIYSKQLSVGQIANQHYITLSYGMKEIRRLTEYGALKLYRYEQL